MKMSNRSALLACLVFGFGWLAGCAGPGRYTIPADGATASPGEAVENAEDYLAKRPDWNIDCSGFVRACYHSAAMTEYAYRQPPARNLAQTLFRFCTAHWHRRAKFADIRPGDIVIFDKTYDANHDGEINEKDKWTHAGIVESFKGGMLTYLDASKGRKGHKLKRRSFSIKNGGKNETVAVDRKTGRHITHRETFNAAFGIE
jgi:cell wall-associated NlpC family hydrolase